MEWLESVAKPQVIGPMIGLFAVIGWAVNKGLQQYSPGGFFRIA